MENLIFGLWGQGEIGEREGALLDAYETTTNIVAQLRKFSQWELTVFENHRKGLIYQKLSYVYILSGQKFIKNAKNKSYLEFQEEKSESSSQIQRFQNSGFNSV